MYAKIFRSLWDGSLADSWEAWATFVFLLAHADAEGFVDMTRAAVARRSGLPLEVVERGLEVLMAADPDSRSPEEGGRRIVLIGARSWGWQIVNYGTYRGTVNSEARRASWRAAQARRRIRAAGDDPGDVTTGGGVENDAPTRAPSSPRADEVTDDPGDIIGLQGERHPQEEEEGDGRINTVCPEAASAAPDRSTIPGLVAATAAEQRDRAIDALTRPVTWPRPTVTAAPGRRPRQGSNAPRIAQEARTPPDPPLGSETINTAVPGHSRMSYARWVESISGGPGIMRPMTMSGSVAIGARWDPDLSFAFPVVGIRPDSRREPGLVMFAPNEWRWCADTARIAQWRIQFPGVSVDQQLRAMQAWLEANPTRRKTPRGMERFIVGWLSREQNRAPAPSSGPPPPTDAERASAVAAQNAREAISELNRAREQAVPRPPDARLPWEAEVAVSPEVAADQDLEHQITADLSRSVMEATARAIDSQIINGEGGPDVSRGT